MLELLLRLLRSRMLCRRVLRLLSGHGPTLPIAAAAPPRGVGALTTSFARLRTG
jgi:hypothetical protein